MAGRAGGSGGGERADRGAPLAVPLRRRELCGGDPGGPAVLRRAPGFARRRERIGRAADSRARHRHRGDRPAAAGAPPGRVVGGDRRERADAGGGARCVACARVSLLAGRIEDPLPEGPFDVVASALCVHHLDGAAKAELFGRVRDALAPDGLFVLGDVVVPVDPALATTPLDARLRPPEPAGGPDSVAGRGGIGAASGLGTRRSGGGCGPPDVIVNRQQRRPDPLLGSWGQ